MMDYTLQLEIRGDELEAQVHQERALSQEKHMSSEQVLKYVSDSDAVRAVPLEICEAIH
jgi:hypothetical protein